MATRLVDSLREQFLRAMTRSVRTGDYFGALTDRFEEVNGPLVHYYTWLVKSAIDPVILESPIPANTLPTGVAFSDPEWRSIVRGSHHSGILTSLPFLLRFPTGRARAARFAEAFLCAPYQAPADLVLPSPSDSCSDEPDLRQRCGCNSCHARLEPEAAWWGRFTDSGAYYLNPFSFPEVRANCANCQAGDGGFCDTICTPFYVTTAGHEKEKAQLGKLKTLEWRSPDELARAESGPEGLVAASLASGQLESCAVRRVFERFHGREPSKTELETVIPDLVDAFTQAHDFKALVGAVVRLPSYREESP